MHPPLLPSRLARDHGHGAGPSLPDPAADVFRLRPRSDLLHLPWFPVRPAPPHDECASEERRAISRSHACPWADPAGSPDCPGPSRRRGAGRRNAGSYGTITVEGSGPCLLLRRSGPDAIGSERASSPEPRPVPARWWGPRPILSFSLRPLVRRESYASRSCIFHSPRTYG